MDYKKEIETIRRNSLQGFLEITDEKKRIFLDKWINKIVEAYNYAKSNSVEIIKTNTVNKIGFGDKKTTDVAFWCNSLFNRLPDHLITNEILTEIDTNILEIKTTREKLDYLVKLITNISCLILLLEKSLQTHPEFTPEGTPNYDKEIHQLTLKKLKSERDKYLLQPYYIHLLALIQVFEEMLKYIANINIEKSEDFIIENEIKVANHRLLLLHKLDLFQPLYKNYHNVLGPKKFATLIKTLLGIPEEEVKSDTFRKTVEYFKNEVNGKVIPKPIITGEASKKVNAFLVELGVLSVNDIEKNRYFNRNN